MVNFYIYAKDFSGSTRNSTYFHKNGVETVDQFKNHVKNIQKDLLNTEKTPPESKIIYLHWGDECFEVDEETTVKSYLDLEGGDMCTEPRVIIEWIQQNYNITSTENKIKLLYIITDGLIGTQSAEVCLELNKEMHYESVVFHAINKTPSEIDLSVAASFLKCHCVIYRNRELCGDVNISEEYNYDAINIDNFTDKKINLKEYIRLKFINKKHDLSLQEIDKLKNLRNRLFMELVLSQKSQNIKVNLVTMDKNTFLSEFVNTDWYRNLSVPAHDMQVDIEKSISTLINYIVSDVKSYAFDALKFETNYDKPINEEPIVDVNFTSEQEIEFPDIILDDEKGIPVILLTELNLLEKIIFHSKEESAMVSPASFNKFKSAMECPLFLLNDPDISESIGYFYTLKVYKQLLEKTTKTEPRTRRPFHGGLVLIDSAQFDKYNDYILSATYFGFKKINYNVGLFYYILWKNCENKEWMDRNVVEQFKKYVMRRISETVCKIGLSSLPLDPTVSTPLPTALWYCVELSTCLFKDDPKNFMHERLRMYSGVAQSMIEILKFFNYNLDLESIEKRCDLIKHVVILKRIPTRVEKIYYLFERIFKKINGFLVSEIENPGNIHKLNYLKLHHKDMLRDDVIEEKINLHDYAHFMHYVDPTTTDVLKLCDKTFRPFFTIDQNKSFYTELIRATKKIVINNDKISYEAIDMLEFNRILSLYNLFINCVVDSEKYPTLSEYIDYISKKKKYNGDLVTIFAPNSCSSAADVYSCYQNIMSKVDVSSFIKVCKSYVNRFERVKVERILKFEDDKDIVEFISKEESKVNLIK